MLYSLEGKVKKMFKQLLLAGVVVANSAAYLGGNVNFLVNNTAGKANGTFYKNWTANVNGSYTHLWNVSSVQIGGKITVGYLAGIMQGNFAEASNWYSDISFVTVTDVSGQTIKIELGAFNTENALNPLGLVKKAPGARLAISGAVKTTDAYTVFAGVELRNSSLNYKKTSFGLVVEFYKNM